MFDGLKEWQTLLTGILATAAAAASIWHIRLQIAQQREAVRYARVRRAESYRPMLSLALSEVCDLMQQEGRLFLDSQNVPPLSWPTSIGAHLEAVRYAIEFEDQNEATRNALKQLINDTQVYRARRRSASAQDPWHRLVDAADLYGLASDLFDYAREEPGEFVARARGQRVKSFLFTLLVVSELQQPDLFDHLQVRFPDHFPAGDGDGDTATATVDSD